MLEDLAVAKLYHHMLHREQKEVEVSNSNNTGVLANIIRILTQTPLLEQAKVYAVVFGMFYALIFVPGW